MRSPELTEFVRLTAPEKILLLEDLWDTIAADEANVPVPQGHRDELDRRLRKYKANPGSLLSLRELQRRLARRK